jgi:hypothetical protein
MSTYRFLQDHDIAGITYLAGTTAATMDVGGTLPLGWRPSGQVDPLDAAGAQDFLKAGPQQLGLARQQWTGISVPRPVTYWVAVTPPGRPGVGQWQLTGLGVGLGVADWVGTRGVVP